jgi:hypothetical protein
MLRAVAAAAAIAFGLVFLTAAPHAPQTAISIADDGGGMVGDYLKFYAMIRTAHIPMRVEGPCISACTLALALPPSQLCTTRTGSFGFHLASVNNIPDPAVTDELASRYYPLAVRKWIEIHGPLKEAPIYLSGVDAIELGIVRECEP